MKLWLKRKILRIYRLLRHPRYRRQSRLHDWVARHVFDRELWDADEKRVAAGTACGLFICMLPIPLQMFVSVAIASVRRWNIPTAALYCWVTSPPTFIITYVPAFFLGLKLTGVDIGLEEDYSFRYTEFMEHFWENSAETIWALFVGCVVMGAALATLGYVAVRVRYAFRKHPPPRKARRRATVS